MPALTPASNGRQRIMSDSSQKAFDMLDEIDAQRRYLISATVLEICLQRKLGISESERSNPILQNVGSVSVSTVIKNNPSVSDGMSCSKAQFDKHCSALSAMNMDYHEYIIASKSRQDMFERMAFVKHVLTYTGTQMDTNNNSLRQQLAKLPCSSASVKGKHRAKPLLNIIRIDDDFSLDESLDVDDQVSLLMEYFEKEASTQRPGDQDTTSKKKLTPKKAQAQSTSPMKRSPSDLPIANTQKPKKKSKSKATTPATLTRPLPPA